MSKYIEFQEVKVTEPIEETTRNGWVKWGKDNLYPQYLVGLYYNSPIHGGIVNSKVRFISSTGLRLTGDIDMMKRVQQNGKSKFTANELMEFFSLDQELFDCFYVLCKKDADGFWHLDHLQAELIRTNEEKSLYYYSNDWSTDRQDPLKTGFKVYKSLFNIDPLTDVECVLQVSSQPRQFMNGKKLTLGHYTIPSYMSGIDSIHTDIEINFFRRAEVTNGYKGGTAISLNNGVPDSEEEAEKLMQSLKEQATDRNKQGGLVVLFSDGKENEPSILQLSGNDLDKRYESTEAGLMQKIMISHSVINPKLFGVLSTSAFSDGDLVSDFMLFKETYAGFRHKQLIEAFQFVHKELNNISMSARFNDFDLVLEKQISNDKSLADELNKMSPLVATKVLEELTPNEIRSLGGLDPVEGGDTIRSKQFSATDEVLDALDKVGSSKDGVKFVFSLPFEGQSDEEILTKFKVIDFASITKKQQDILGLITSGESYTAIAEATKLKPEQLAVEIMSLEKNGYLSGWEVTGKGLKEIASVETMEVVYSYEKRPDAPPLKGESREFCTELLRRNRIYQRSDIDQITDAVGRDVWSYRGGWYNNPETGKNQPSCRHYWQQHLIIKRK